MKAVELRIGNWLMSDGIPVQIDGRTIFDFWHYGENGFMALRYEPIPLTEEWLERLDVKWCVTKDYNDLWAYCITEDFYVHVRYVHDIQNLHYALKGEELELKQ